MRTIEDSDLALFVRFDITHHTDIQRTLRQLQLLCQPLRSLDHKQVKMLRGIEKRIVIAKCSLQRSGFFARIAGDNTVDQRGTERVCRLHPVGKCRRKLPLLRIPQHQGFERLTVIVDKLARNNYPALIHRALKVVKALHQQARQFGRKAHRRRIIHTVCRVIANSGFGSI